MEAPRLATTERKTIGQLPTATLAEVAQVQAWVKGFTYQLLDAGLWMPGGCVAASILCHHELAKAGYRPVWQAGTAMFRRVEYDENSKLDDMFSYMFAYDVAHDPDGDQSLRYDLDPALDKLAAGQLGEVHAWVALPDLGLVVDASAPLVPEHCKAITGMPWQRARPRSVIPVQELDTHPAETVYWPDTAAVLALSLWLDDTSQRIIKKMAPENPRAGPWLREATAVVRRMVGWPVTFRAKDLARSGAARNLIHRVKQEEAASRENPPPEAKP